MLQKSEQVFSISSIEELDELAVKLIPYTNNYKIWAFYGTMGAGKTTFIRSLCNYLGVIDNVNSPTFSIVNEYHTQQQDKIFHFDFYRINSIKEAYDMGYEEYFYSGNLCLIEWPDRIEQLLPEKYLKVAIEVHEKGRIFTLSFN
jgi:tRNA threonylcarbamoyladenosine biosynthesis protein TsaE